MNCGQVRASSGSEMSFVRQEQQLAYWISDTGILKIFRAVNILTRLPGGRRFRNFKWALRRIWFWIADVSVLVCGFIGGRFLWREEIHSELFHFSGLLLFSVRTLAARGSHRTHALFWWRLSRWTFWRYLLLLHQHWKDLILYFKLETILLLNAQGPSALALSASFSESELSVVFCWVAIFGPRVTEINIIYRISEKQHRCLHQALNFYCDITYNL